MLYKFTLADGTTRNGYHYPLPHDGKPGEWTPKITKLRMCDTGYHLCTDPFNFLEYGPRMWHAEGRGKHTNPDDTGQTVWSSVRLIREVRMTAVDLWLLACDYGEHVLHGFESVYPRDERPRRAIATVRRYAQGTATLTELRAATDAAHTAYLTSSNTVATTAAYVSYNIVSYAAYAAHSYNSANDAADAAVSAIIVSNHGNTAELRWRRKLFRTRLAEWEARS